MRTAFLRSYRLSVGFSYPSPWLVSSKLIYRHLRVLVRQTLVHSTTTPPQIDRESYEAATKTASSIRITLLEVTPQPNTLHINGQTKRESAAMAASVTASAHTHSHGGGISHSHGGGDAFGGHGHSHEILDGPGSFLSREQPISQHEGRDWKERAFTIGIGG
jgi:hypothetical protein